MDTTKINELSNQLQSLSCYDASQPFPFNVVLAVREGIASVAQQISGINPPISSHLIDLKSTLFTEMPYQCIYINPVVYGQTLEAVEVVKGQIFAANQEDDRGLCHLLHPDIQRVSEKLYKDGSYAEAACNAFIEINSRLKELYCAAHPESENIPDGQPLMNKFFSDTDPVLEAGDRTTQTGKDIHAGTRFLFAGLWRHCETPKLMRTFRLGKMIPCGD